ARGTWDAPHVPRTTRSALTAGRTGHSPKAVRSCAISAFVDAGAAYGVSGGRRGTSAPPACHDDAGPRARLGARSVTRDVRARERGHRLRFDSAPLDTGPGATDPCGAS